MTVRVGVIGTGMIGEDHVRRLTTVVAGAAVTAVTDVDKDRAAAVAERFGGPTVHASGEDVIADAGVDGVVVASWGPTHEEYVLASIAAEQARLLREAAGYHAGGLLADHRRGDRGGPAARPGRLHAPLRRRLPGAEGRGGGRLDRHAAARAHGAPQPLGAAHRDQRDGDQRLGGARDRRDPVAAGRGDHRRDDHVPETQPEGGRGAAGSDDRGVPHRERCPGRRRAERERPVRLRHPGRDRRGNGQRAAGQRRGHHGHQRAGPGGGRPGGLAGAVRRRLRRGVPGLDQRCWRGPRGQRPQLMGWLRGRGRRGRVHHRVAQCSRRGASGVRLRDRPAFYGA